ncbi:MAG: hypothetical protein GYB67_06290 [Chloroflexi bacterium]|nr:hypothetical protein [Chloroflexota bacterium]
MLLKQSDVKGRLNLLRYGLIVVVVMSFILGLLVPFVIAQPYAVEINALADAVEAAGGNPERANIQITDFVDEAVIVTVVVAVVSVLIYFGYRAWLMNQQGGAAQSGDASTQSS